MLDKFFTNQPECTFINTLKEYETPIINRVEPIGENSISVCSVCLNKGDFKEDSALKTVYDYFERFSKYNALCGNDYTLTLKKDESLKFEQYEIDVQEKNCIIKASEREGVRRALVRFTDLLLLGGGNLKKGKTKYSIEIECRLARCFFAPINRPPRNVAELDDDVDYYPDAYLDRLMRDGANAVWVYSDLDHLVRSTYIEEFGKDSEKRIKKLNALIEKCARYGIKVYVFFIAPMSLDEQALTSRYGALSKKYSQVNGNSVRGPKGFCTYTEFGRAYLEDAIVNLVKSAPNLGGIISITLGERVTSCGNTWSDLSGVWNNNCPHCKDKSRMEIVAHTAEIIKGAINKVNPEIDFISWTYGHRGNPKEVIEEYVDKCPKDVVMLQNFEDDGRVYQLGKKRFALDYYLSYAGPSDMFKYTADRAVKEHKRVYAKMQACCSHELATVPYIPVPGLIYDKVVRAKKLGVSGIMESWLFGNYPCLMSKAVGMLSADTLYETKREFLEELAGIYFNTNDSVKVAKAWECFEKGYTQYPVNVMFNYYGPMHDGVVWELTLNPKNLSLPRTWKLEDRPCGDRIGECLFNGHTLEEAIILSEEVSKCWSEGLKYLSETSAWNDEFNEQISIAKALGVLFNSGCNILKFYKLRDSLGYGDGDARKTLSLMKEIVYKEIENSTEMIKLCKLDNRLGYHSEAEGYKFFPEKLECRIECLKKLLQEDFINIENRIEKGEIPLEYYLGKQSNAKRLTAGRNGLESANWATLNDNESKFRVAVGEDIEIEIISPKKEHFCISNEFRLMFPESMIVVSPDGKLSFQIEASSHQSMLDEKINEELSKWKVESLSGKEDTHLILRINKADTNFIRLPYKFLIKTYSDVSWCVDNESTRTLGKWYIAPDDYGWID
ncbi:MAG: hypothetical protein IJB32_03330 [Clostridia bacterium]|nr:hypothetical protein [Clostridia bacterium]